MIYLCKKFPFFLEILEHKMDGILSILEDGTKKRIPSVKNLMNRIIETCSRKTAFGLPKLKQDDALFRNKSSKNEFIIRHFAKHVCYSVVILI